MTTEETLQRIGLIPEDEHLDEVRALLAREADAERTGATREEDLALLCCVQLFSRGVFDDVFRIWEAKRSGFDLGCYLSVQLLCGAGLSRTKQRLAESQDPRARAILDGIEASERLGDFDEFSPEAYLGEWKRYFGV